MKPCRPKHNRPQSPAPQRGVFFARCFCAVFALAVFTSSALAEVYISTQQLAQRIEAEQRRVTLAVNQTDAQTDAADGDWHAGVRPLLILHVEHDRTGYDTAHLAGAVFFEGRSTYDYDRDIGGCLPPTEKLAELLAEHGVTANHDIVLYGEAAGLFPARVYAALAVFGLDENARMLDGHKRVWIAEGRPTTADVTAPNPAPPLVIPADTGRVLRHGPPDNWDRTTVTLDARVPTAYSGKNTLPKSDLRGHLPGSVNLPWIPLIENMKQPRLVDDAEALLRDAIQAGSEPGQSAPRVIVLDDRGNAAPVLFAIARHFGWDAYWDERGVLGRLADGQSVVTSPTPSSAATP